MYEFIVIGYYVILPHLVVVRWGGNYMKTVKRQRRVPCWRNN